MENDRLKPKHDPEYGDDDSYIYPQMNYCCGSKGIDLSQKFKDERTQCIFVGMAFVIKLIEITFIAFVVYDISADGEDQLKFNIGIFLAEEIKPYNWIIFIAASLVLLTYFSARCGGAGRGFCSGLFLSFLKTLAIAIFCGCLITFEWVWPFRYIILLVIVAVALACLGICLLTTLFEMNVLGRAVYSALFMYFLFIFLVAHFAWASSLREKYGLKYLTFIQHVGIGTGAGLIFGWVMFWYVGELITGKVISLNEHEFIYATLLF